MSKVSTGSLSDGEILAALYNAVRRTDSDPISALSAKSIIDDILIDSGFRSSFVPNIAGIPIAVNFYESGFADCSIYDKEHGAGAGMKAIQGALSET